MYTDGVWMQIITVRLIAGDAYSSNLEIYLSQFLALFCNL